MSKFESISSVRAADLVHELSSEAVEFYSNLELGEGWSPNDSPNIGKFVRLGNVIILGSSIPYGAHRDKLRHFEIADIGFNGLEEEAKKSALEAIANSPIIGMDIINDAGMFIVRGSENAQMLALSGESGDYGKADYEGRQATTDIAQQIVGEQVEVLALD